MLTNKNYKTEEQKHNFQKRAVGVEFQVNSYTTEFQSFPVVSALNTGDFIIAWHSNGQDGSAAGIFAKRYTSLGIPQGNEIQVNGYASSYQWYPAISTLASGEFVVVWMSYAQDGSEYGIYGKRYSSTNIPQGSEFQVNTYTTSHQQNPSIGALTSGEFVVVWNSDGQDGSNWGIYAQRYNSIGAPQGNEFRVNTYTLDGQRYPVVCGLTSGDFVVVWMSNSQDGSTWGIYGQRFDSLGLSQDSEFQVNNYTMDSQATPSVSALPTSGFVVVWNSNGQDGSMYGIYGQRYTSTGVKQGGEFRVNSYTTSNQSHSTVKSLALGGFIVSWVSEGQDTSENGVYAQRYNDDAVKQGGEFRINNYTTGNQGDFSYRSQALCELSNSDFVVTWMSENQDGDSWGIYAHIFPNDTSLSTTSLTSSISSSLSSSLSSSISTGLTSGMTPQPIPQPSPSPMQIPIPQSIPVNINPITTSLTNSSAQPLYSPEFFSSTSGVTSLTSTTNTGVVETPTDSNSISIAVPIAIGASVLALLAGFGLWRQKQKRDKPTKKMDIEMVHHTQHEEAQGNYRKLPDLKMVDKGYGEIVEPPSAYQPVPKKPGVMDLGYKEISDNNKEENVEYRKITHGK